MLNKLIVLLVLSLCIYGCDKDDSSPFSSSFSAKIDGINFEPDSSFALLIIDSTIHIRGISILAFKDDSILSVGRLDYNLSQQLPLNINFGDSLTLIDYAADSSSDITHILSVSFIITKQDTLNKKISGRFSGSIANRNYSDTLNITDGNFENVTYELMISN